MLLRSAFGRSLADHVEPFRFAEPLRSRSFDAALTRGFLGELVSLRDVGKVDAGEDGAVEDECFAELRVLGGEHESDARAGVRAPVVRALDFGGSDFCLCAARVSRGRRAREG